MFSGRIRLGKTEADRRFMSGSKPKSSKALSDLAAIAFREYSPRLHAYLARRLHQGSDVPNLAMEVYERFLRTNRIESIRNPEAWLFRIAQSVVSDNRRMEASRPVRYDSNAVDEATETAELATPDTLGDQVDSEQQLQRVSEAMQELRPMHRAVLWLAVHDGLSHKEVARCTGLTAATVALYICEARAQLRSILVRRQGR
jgi:RNA polymerase sigma factor (sigma-70 family)